MEAFILLGFSGMGNRYGSESIEPVKVVIYFNICKPWAGEHYNGEFSDIAHIDAVTWHERVSWVRHRPY
jgi:hypothetical protein